MPNGPTTPSDRRRAPANAAHHAPIGGRRGGPARPGARRARGARLVHARARVVGGERRGRQPPLARGDPASPPHPPGARVRRRARRPASGRWAASSTCWSTTCARRPTGSAATRPQAARRIERVRPLGRGGTRVQARGAHARVRPRAAAHPAGRRSGRGAARHRQPQRGVPRRRRPHHLPHDPRPPPLPGGVGADPRRRSGGRGWRRR